MTPKSEHKGSEQSGITAAEKQRRALEARKAGASYRAIAETTGYAGPSGAHKAVTSALKALVAEPAEELRTLEVARLDDMLWSLRSQLRAGNLGAIDRALRIMERRSKLLGLDAPAKVHGELLMQTLSEQAAVEFGLEPAQVMDEALRILRDAAEAA